MKRTTGIKTDDVETSTETESFIAVTPRRASDCEAENSSSVSVTSDEVAWPIRAVTDLLTQQLAHICNLMRELKNEHANRRHEDTASFRAASSTSNGDCRCDTPY